LHAAILMAAALAVASSASAQITVTIDSVNPGEIVNLVVTPTVGSGVPAYNGVVYAGIYNLTVNGAPVPTFCIDVAHDVYLGETFHDYSYTALASAPASPAGPMNITQAADIEKLWAAYYSAAKNSPVMAAALQVAIWETLGNGNQKYTVTESDNVGVATEAAGMLAALPGLSREANVNALVSSDGQGYAADPQSLPPSVVPEPSTMLAGALLLLPFGASTLRILRRNRTA